MPALHGAQALFAAIVGGAAGLATILGVGAMLRKAGKMLARLVRGLLNIIDDWKGEPPRDGVPGRPGVMARLAALERSVQGVRQGVEGVKVELKSNGGSTLADAVGRVEEHLGTKPTPP